MIKRPEAVVFDMDGLLFDSEAIYRDAILAAAVELGHGFTEEDFLKLVGLPWSVNQIIMQKHIGPGGDVEAFRAAWMRHFDNRKPTLALKTGVVDLLQLLDELHLPRAICTSSSHEDVEHNLILHSLRGRFDAIVAAGDYERGKPFPDPYLRAASVLGIEPPACLALEDSHNGVRSAAAAGMQTVMVPDLLPPIDDVARLCTFVARDLNDVREHLVQAFLSTR